MWKDPMSRKVIGSPANAGLNVVTVAAQIRIVTSFPRIVSLPRGQGLQGLNDSLTHARKLGENAELTWASARSSRPGLFGQLFQNGTQLARRSDAPWKRQPQCRAALLKLETFRIDADAAPVSI